jgi:hypothetical protein
VHALLTFASSCGINAKFNGNPNDCTSASPVLAVLVVICLVVAVVGYVWFWWMSRAARRKEKL